MAQAEDKVACSILFGSLGLTVHFFLNTGEILFAKTNEKVGGGLHFSRHKLWAEFRGQAGVANTVPIKYD